jgi:hypothetical protein
MTTIGNAAKTITIIGVALAIIATVGAITAPPDTTSYDQGFFYGGLFGMFMAYVALAIVDEFGKRKGGKCTEKPIS